MDNNPNDDKKEAVEGKETKSIKFVSVCRFCGFHDDKEGTIEFNFRDEKVYFLCPKCKKLNEMTLKSNYQPFPKSVRL